MNPILPKEYYIPDVEARSWKDGRLYLYGSWDKSGDDNYCSDKYHVFSTADMIHWTDHGLSFDVSRSHSEESDTLYAPDCFYKDGNYYLLYCDNYGREGIAESSHPEGPFSMGKAIVGADGDGIDPSVLHDDDGSVYYFWGQFSLRGARLNDDLTSLDLSTLQKSILTEEKDGFHEGSSIRKRNGLYYLVYTDTSRGKATSLAYAISKNPLGPYEKKGIIIDNDGCDPQSWNNHGSIEEYKGNWYVFYHRSSQNSKMSRRVCVELLTFREDGTIDEAEMTTQGGAGPIDARNRIDAYRACSLSGNVYSNPDDEMLINIHNGDSAAFKYLNFNKDIQFFEVTVSSPFQDGKIEVRCDSPQGPILCECLIPYSGKSEKSVSYKVELFRLIEGVRAIYLLFKGKKNQLFNLMDITFK